MIHSPSRSRASAGSLAIRCLAGVIALSLYGDALASEPAAKTRDMLVCSAWDVHITTQIEDFGRLELTDPRTLADSAFRQIQARVLCESGRVREAVQVYESISFSFLPNDETLQ